MSTTTKKKAVATPAPVRPTREEDHALTLKVLRSILNAQARGVLSAELNVRRLPTQIVLENVTEADYQWLTKKYKGATESKGWMWRDWKVKGTKVSRTKEEGVYKALLRKPFDGTHIPDFVPKLEIWGIQVDHVHGNPKGALVNGRAVWRCGACNTRMDVA